MTNGRIQVGAEFGGAATVTVPVFSAPVAMSGTAPTWPVMATPAPALAVELELGELLPLLLVQAFVDTLDLDLRRELDRGRSEFLHRLDALGIGFGQVWFSFTGHGPRIKTFNNHPEWCVSPKP